MQAMQLDTRRRFIAHFAGLGLGGTLVPGVLWARMQDAGVQKVTLAMVTDALQLSGIELSEEDRQAMVENANRNLAQYEELHATHIPNDVSPPFHFSPITPGMTVNRARQPWQLSAAPKLKRPANLEDAAFWPVRHLAELIRTRQVTSLELTEMYLARLHRYNGLLNNVVTFLDDHGRAEAKRADSEIAAGKYKAEGHPFAPLTDEARANLQRRVEESYRRFVAAVAAGRGVSEATMREGYGQGRLLGAREALAAGMVDEIATIDDVVADLAMRGARAPQKSSRATRQEPLIAATRQERAADVNLPLEPTHFAEGGKDHLEHRVAGALRLLALVLLLELLRRQAQLLRPQGVARPHLLRLLEHAGLPGYEL